MISVLLADEHRLVREALIALLNNEPGMRVVADTGEQDEVLDLIEQSEANVVVLNWMRLDLEGLELIRRVHERFPWVAIVSFSENETLYLISEVFRRGAVAYVLKRSETSTLVDALHSVSMGERFLDPALALDLGAMASFSREEEGETDPYAVLTKREREVMQLVVEGRSLKESAERLNISPRTVERHRENLMRKMGFSNQTELVRFAVYRGLVGPPSPEM